MADTKTNRSMLFAFASGIFIPLVAAAIPYLIDLRQASEDLTFRFEGPIEIENAKAFSISVRNEGKKLEESIEIQLPDKLEENYKISTTSPYELEQTKDFSILKLGDLRPEEELQVSILVDDSTYFLHLYSLEKMKVRSKDQLAKLDEPNEMMEFFYMAGFWGFILLFLLSIFAGIYQEFFESKEAKEKRLMKELEKL